MPPIAYLLVTIGVVAIRQVMVGRASDLPGDTRDLFLALLQGDTAEVKNVLSRRGENVPESGYGSGSDSGTVTGGTQAGNSFAYAVKQHGDAAQGYRLGSTGPDYYDCSGLIWKTMRDIGVFDGPRFTTSTFRHVAEKQGWKKVGSPVVGAVVLWAHKHMGVSLGGDTMYSARSPEKGIGTSTISGDSTYFGFEPEYWIVVSTNYTQPETSPGGGGGSW